MSQFAVQVSPLEGVPDDDFSRFALRMTGMQNWDVEQASFLLRVGYVYFGTRSEADEAAAKLSGSSLNGVALQLRSVVLIEDDFGIVAASPSPPEPVVERRRSEDKPRHKPESGPSTPGDARPGGNSATIERSESSHRHRHRKVSSYSSSSYSSSSDSPDERSRSSHRSHRHHHHHRRHHHRHSREQK